MTWRLLLLTVVVALLSVCTRTCIPEPSPSHFAMPEGTIILLPKTTAMPSPARFMPVASRPATPTPVPTPLCYQMLHNSLECCYGYVTPTPFTRGPHYPHPLVLVPLGCRTYRPEP